MNPSLLCITVHYHFLSYKIPGKHGNVIFIEIFLTRIDIQIYVYSLKYKIQKKTLGEKYGLPTQWKFMIQRVAINYTFINP